MKSLFFPCLLTAFFLFAATVEAQEKFSLSMFHFNVQYVAGGLQGFPSGDDSNPDFADLGDEAVQDLIIIESFEPVLDLFLAHPNWHVTLEMQAYMVQIMLDRHPGVLAKLKQLLGQGQVELVSFHWSDQLFLAYPRLDLERSFEEMDRVWAEAGITPSPVVFCQEGQFGVGMGPVAAAHGRKILVLPKNLFRYQHLDGYESAAPLYSLDGMDVVIGARSFADEQVEVSWNFFDDGELLATNGRDPYLGPVFVQVPSAVAEYEQELQEAEAAGFRIASIGEYVAWAKEQGLSQPDLPPILDGTWQPPSTDSMHRWMGAGGLIDLVYQCERDNQVLTGNVRARHWIEVAEVLTDHALSEGWLEDVAEQKDRLAGCWRDVLLAQVSDATGINPFVGEVQYGLAHAEAARTCALQIVHELAQLGQAAFLRIDTYSRTVSDSDDKPGELLTAVEPLFTEAQGFEVLAPGRDVILSWQQVGDEEGLVRLRILTGPPADGERLIEVAFPMALQGFYLTPGLLENEAVYWPFLNFDFQDGRITLPLANGLIGLDDHLWLIKYTATVHVGATVVPGSGELRFVTDTLDPELGLDWTFYLFSGNEADALDLATRLNLHPLAWVETGNGSSRGCGCGSPADGGLLFLALGLVFFLRQVFKR
ncbi:MAG: hypothetical protein JRF33_08905 [Deltaproteobacteria bacterium]|nr:hypothetical protein [Deltaproteobacteria bacterium]